MKIAFLNIYQGAQERGSENFMTEITERLSQNHKVDVFQGNRKLKKRWPLLWRFFIDPPGLSVLLWTIKQIPKLIKEKYDFVIPLNGGWQSAIIRIITWILGSKMVISGHSGIGWDDINNLWCFPDCFVTLSSRARDWAKGVNPLVKTIVIPDGVDLGKFTPYGEKAKLNLEKPVVLAVAALEKGKRLDLAIKAVSKLTNGSLLILGGGYLEEEIKMKGSEFLGKRFLLKEVPYKEIPKYYRAVDVFTLPSWSREAFGMVYLEAMASGLPVVATNDYLRREIVGDAGILVDPIIVEDYTKALEKCADTDWGNKPRSQAEKFGWDKVSRMYEDLFLKLTA